MKKTQSGFTLIELMVVIGIIGLLAAALLPAILENKVDANKAADEANLRWHYQAITRYENRYKRYPPGGGCKFIIGPWVSQVVEATPQNLDRYFSAQEKDQHKFELSDQGVANIWKRIEDVTSQDTNFAGRAKEHMRGMVSGNEIWMATDNEFGGTYPDGSIVVLNGDGSTRQFLRDRELKDYIDLDDKSAYVKVGPESPHPGLQKLAY
ncbi:MAG: prepilin-type N-terminal cleavage/methylation domain-containing protein [Planctomycetes bacterium]|nr:prepilin-type N-terminal cleavage/methylation domain-containing protein [Planctomycetota bacterium]MCB9869600.1 prepilin-type N-terminal cleavage/methylation domain-containing protein [Planctomycetota bacterium]MCB9889847.1 prepilin-type N-terminal cleavage/methylation domain-containing protein [Planctomycetota bacterium]